jgi:hypothetical protein
MLRQRRANKTGFCGSGYCAGCQRCAGCWTHPWCWLWKVVRAMKGNAAKLKTWAKMPVAFGRVKSKTKRYAHRRERYWLNRWGMGNE